MARKTIYAVFAALEKKAGRYFAKFQRNIAIIVDYNKGKTGPQ